MWGVRQMVRGSFRRWGYSFLFGLGVSWSAAQGALLVNPAQPIDRRVTVRPIVVSNDDGSDTATFFGSATQRAAIETFIDTIWAQAGIDIEFQTSVAWNNTFAKNGTADPRPGGDLGLIASAGIAAGVAAPSPVLNMYFVDNVPGFGVGDLDANTSAGLAFLPGQESTLFVGSSLLTFTAGREVIAAVVAHEIGHNLGLPHVGAVNNLMTPGSNGQLLSADQITTSRASSFTTPITVLDTVGPQVAQVRLGNPNWSVELGRVFDATTPWGYPIPGGAQQARPAPWTNISQVQVKFDEPVIGSGNQGALAASDFALVDHLGTAITISNVGYDANTRVATLDLGQQLGRGRYELRVKDTQVTDATGNQLDGEWVNNSTTGDSGNGTPGGEFRLTFNVSPSDFTTDGAQSGLVNFFDLSALGLAYGAIAGTSNSYSPFVDGNGDGRITFSELSLLGLNYGQSLPALSPAPLSPAGGDSVALGTELTSVVPEPHGVAMLWGVLGAGWAWRRRR